MMSAIELLAFLVVVHVIGIIAHELMHAIAYRRITGRRLTLKINWKGIKCGTKKDYARLSEEQYRAVLASGVIGGIVCLFVVFSTFPVQSLFFPLAALHLWGSRSDLRSIALSQRRSKHK